MAGQLVALQQGKTIADAADAFLSRAMAITTRRSYTQTMHRLTAEHGALPVATLDSATLDAFTAATWSGCRPATWNRHVATLRSFTAFARRHGWIAGDPAGILERRTEPADRTKAIPRSSLERLFRRDDVALREKCLWRLLYETAGRAHEVLSADIADLDLDNKRLRVRRKGGDSDWLHFQSGSARLLPRLIGDRDAGPIFLADRRPSPARAPASLDLCSITGRGRLSYERSAYLFKQHSQKVSKTPRTLHQLRHSALTHLAEDGVNLPLLMAKSGHQNLRSLQKYARPSAEAVAAITAAHDPARRRR
ncbi:MAG: integrase/recombinase XerD [Gaiellales bacterium]|jgi:site-specific recombinase XerD|nr:integrase/recombinase XerD [Gaiellales bacterium]